MNSVPTAATGSVSSGWKDSASTAAKAWVSIGWTDSAAMAWTDSMESTGSVAMAWTGLDGLGIDGLEGLGIDGELDGEGMLGGRVGCGMLIGDEHAARATIVTHAESWRRTPATYGAPGVRAPTSGMLWVVDVMAGSPFVSAS